MTRAEKAAAARHRLDRRLTAPGNLHAQLAMPAKGWIRAIRDALGMTAAQLAARMGISAPTVVTLERSETKGSIQLSSLRRAAEAMNCTLVYALLPNEALDGFVRKRARQIAGEQLKPVEQTMRLENQGLSEADAEEFLDEYIRTGLDPRHLWDKL